MKVLSSDRGQRLQDESHVEVSNSSVREYDEFTLCGRFMTYHFTPGTLGDYVTLYYVTLYFVTCYYVTLTMLIWDTGLTNHHISEPLPVYQRVFSIAGRISMIGKIQKRIKKFFDFFKLS